MMSSTFRWQAFLHMVGVFAEFLRNSVGRLLMRRPEAETCQHFDGNVAFLQPQGGKTGLVWALLANMPPIERAGGRNSHQRGSRTDQTVHDTKHRGRSQGIGRNVSEAAEPAARQAQFTPFVIAFIVLAAGIQGLWMAFLIWLAIRTIF
jgi:hypothetical protein